MDFEFDEETLGSVLEMDRGSLPFALIHGESLVACAAWAMGEAGVRLLDHGVDWGAVVESEALVVLHDALCPMTPADFLMEIIEAARADEGAVLVGVRPVTDTIKATADGYVTDTIDREGLWQVTSPLVLPPPALAALGAAGASSTDFPTLLEVLHRAGLRIVPVEAPATARRVADLDDVRMLEVLTAR